MIKSIELKNWKTHKNTKLDFSKGTNILIGQMGAGKSSLMDAISFALFGTFPAIQHKKVNVGKLIRNKPEQEKEGHVRLNLEINGDNYTITREMSLNGKSTATIEKNGTYLQSQPERVTEEVERILKVDYDLFSKAVYSEQNQLDYFLDLRSADRKKQIDGLLGLDKFSTAQENATSIVNRIRDMIADSERMAREFDVNKVASELQELKSSLNAVENEKSEAERGIKQCKEERSRLESEVNRLKEMQSRRTLLLKEIEGLKGRMSLLESEMKKADNQQLHKKVEVLAEKESLRSALEKLKSQESQNAEAERRLHTEMAKIDAALANARKDSLENSKITKELEKNKKELIQKDIAEINDSIGELSIALAHSISTISETEKQLKELKGHISKCPICERELDAQMVTKITDGKNKLMHEHAVKSKELEALLSKKKIELKELTSLLNSVSLMEEKHRSYSGIEERIKSYESEISSAKKQYEKIKAARESYANEIQSSTERLQKTISSIETIERIERYVSEKEKLSIALSEKTASCYGIIVDEKMIDALQSQLIKSESEISKHTANLNSAIKSIREKEVQIKEKESEIERINKIHEELSKKKSLVENLSKFKISLAETQSVLRVQLINSINEIMHEVWKELYPYGDYQSVILDASENGYELKVKTLINKEYVWEDVESIASGGERSTACLAMRVAFSLVLVPNLKWLILDEPTHNIDQQGLSKFVQMFSETLPGIVDQVFIITHDELLKQVSDAKIYVLSRNKEENGPTQVSEA